MSSSSAPLSSVPDDRATKRVQREEARSVPTSSTSPPHRHHRALPQPTFAPHSSTAYGDWVAELDTSDPIIADQIYGDQDDDDDERGGVGSARPSMSRRGYSSESRNSEEEAEEEVEEEEHLRWTKSKVWYRRPDEKWLRPFAFLLALASGMIMGPKVEMYYSIVCEEIGIAGSSAHLWNTLPPFQQRPPVSTQCHKSLLAQSAQASLQLRLTLAMGLLAVLTTGYWGGLSDRKGRTYILRLAVFGLTINDITFLIVGLFPPSSLPFGKNFLVIGSAFEGCLGGFATLAASHQAYISDVTPNGTRANIFSFFTGILFFGFAVGPSFGGWLSKYTNSLMVPFYFALASHILYLLFTSFVLPESVSPERQQRAEEDYRKQWEDFLEETRSRSTFKSVIYALAIPFKPLGLLLPHRRHDEDVASKSARLRANASDESCRTSSSHISVSQTQTQKLDWNLTLLALTYFIATLCVGILTPKINYAQYTFDWGVEELGYYLSFASFSRVVCLTIIIPLVIKWWHKPIKGIALPHDGLKSGSNVEEGERRHLLDEEGRPAVHLGHQYGSLSDHAERTFSTREVEKLWTLRSRHLRQIHDSAFDKRLAITSIIVDSLCYVLLALGRNRGPVPFLIATALTSLGGAAASAMSSLALALLEKDSDAGKMFAAWSVLSAVSTTVLGPVLFIELWKRTVSWAPELIFVVAFALFIIAAVTLSFVQVRNPMSLPSLPPRPHTTASVKAKTSTGEDRDGARSRLRK
ncbi:hypothetical protein CBS101457_003405 [Exobasidium rhododendri]|nr:hypothetical protein CBS101457_003405 [Exobasidium rhododendri]